MQMVDAQLVELSRSGDRDAFAEIVRRYQNLVCSIAYGITGSLEASEEVAQEAFIAAWQSIAQLREPDKLRQWISGIVRNLARSRGRVVHRDVLTSADEIDATHVDVSAFDPAASSIAREEVDLLDRTLCSLPQEYREPLVLYYREQESVSRVAELLELSPNTVKQRLARGRQMLREEIAAVVERGLSSSAPSSAFTFAVLAALPVLSGSVKTVSVTLAGAKGVSAMNAASWGGMIGAVLGPLAGILGGWFGYRMSLRAAGSQQERDFIKRQAAIMVLAIGTFSMALLAIMASYWWLKLSPMQLTIAVAVLMVAYIASLLMFILWTNRKMVLIRDELTRGNVASVTHQPDPFRTMVQGRRSYESRAKFLGLPLLCIQIGGGPGLGAPKPAVAKGWIAIGDVALGGLMAFGNLSVGTIACGAISFGVISAGGLGVGVLALGGMALGAYSAGGMAIGWIASGGIAMAWYAAFGGLAVAHDIAVGGIATATHANDEIARAYVRDSQFIQAAQQMNTLGWMVLVVVILLPIFLVMRYVPASPTKNAQSTDD